jgi:hypothetical protein
MKIAFATLFAALFLTATAAHASAIIQSGSGYGMNTPSETPQQCAASGDPCISFELDASTVNIGGTSTEVSIYGYNNGTVGSVYDVVEFDVAAGASVDIPVTDTSLATTGVFECGTGNSTANTIKDSTPTGLYTFPCTADTLAGDISDGIDSTGTGVAFTNNDSVAVEVAIATLPGNLSGGTTTAPEPSSLALLAAGLLPLALLAKRRLQA